MFEALERLPEAEAASRLARCRELMARMLPEAGGMLVFSRVATYYFTGHLGGGLLWLPMTGRPVLLCRKGLARARLESPLADILPFKSFGQAPALFAEAGSPLAEVVAAEQGGLTWSLANLLTERLSGTRFVSGDGVLARTQAVKSEWELEKLRLCGARHHEGLRDILPSLIHPGQSERELSHKAWEVFFSLGHMGQMRMGAFGEEIFLGHVAAGDSGNYPSVFNGPVGLRGEHPAVPFGGYDGKIWRAGEPLTMDIGFALEGYQTDKTQIYWAGPASSIPDDVRRGHDLCVEVQAMLAENLRPGAIPSELYFRAVAMAEKAGLAEGFMGLGENKVPFLGHGIGLAIDGWPVLAKGFDDPLEVGTTLALEPKLGLPGLGMVGVENTFEVTETGGRCLTGGVYDIVPVE